MAHFWHSQFDRAWKGNIPQARPDSGRVTAHSETERRVQLDRLVVMEELVGAEPEWGGHLSHEVQVENKKPMSSQPQRRIVFGHPEFWPKIETEYPKFFEVVSRASDALNGLTNAAYPSPQPYQRAILNLSMLAGISFLEISTLVGNGMGHGALRTLRTLLENTINTEYLRLRPAEFEDYKEWYWVERFKEQEFLRAHVPDFFKQLDTKAVEETETNMARVKSRFEQVRPDGSRRIRASWCSLDLGSRAVATGYEELYRLINPLASSFVHETMYGLMKHYDETKDIDRVDIPPSLEWSAQALSGGHNCILKVTRTLSETFGVPPQPSIADLEKDWHYAWVKQQP